MLSLQPLLKIALQHTSKQVLLSSNSGKTSVDKICKIYFPLLVEKRKKVLIFAIPSGKKIRKLAIQFFDLLGSHKRFIKNE